MTRKILTMFAAFLVTAGVALSFVHPWGDLRNVSAGGELLGGSNVPPDVRQMLETKCADCHSNQTHWPLYSRFVPGSLLIEHDVSEGRMALNLSRWETMRPDERIDALSRISAEIRSGEMPPKQYTMMHPANRLSAEEVQKTATWARTERRLLRSAAATEKETGGQ